MYTYTLPCVLPCALSKTYDKQYMNTPKLQLYRYVRVTCFSKLVLSRHYSTKKDRTPPEGHVNNSHIDLNLLQHSGSKWHVEHAANIGIRWDPEMKFPEAHPAECYGPLHTIKAIMKDPTTTESMKGFLTPILNKDGPDHTDHFSSFAKETKEFVKGHDICEAPQDESLTRQMILDLSRAVGFHNATMGLHTKIERPIITNFTFGTVYAKPELIIGKVIDEDVLYQLVFSEPKPLKPESRARGEGQVVGETAAALLYNYAKTKEAIPVIVVYVNGYFLRFISCVPQQRYLGAVSRGNLKGASAPVFSAYPAFDDAQSPKMQGFNLLSATGRFAAVQALVQIRHNLICACSRFARK